jgi:gamma-glutamylcyclotransferase
MPAIFAFGSNMHHPQMFDRCPNSKVVGCAILDDYELSFGGHSERWNGAVATVVKAPGKRCFGVLYEVPKADLVRLDAFEGVPYVYERFEVFVRTKVCRKAFAYRLISSRAGVPSSAYLSRISGAYAANGFDRSCLRDAIENVGGSRRFSCR